MSLGARRVRKNRAWVTYQLNKYKKLILEGQIDEVIFSTTQDNFKPNVIEKINKIKPDIEEYFTKIIILKRENLFP